MGLNRGLQALWRPWRDAEMKTLTFSARESSVEYSRASGRDNATERLSKRSPGSVGEPLGGVVAAGGTAKVST